MVEEKETKESVAGETRSAELSEDEKNRDEEIGTVEGGMMPEDLEKLEKIIRDVVTRSSLEKMKNEINEEGRDDNDNDKEVKIWALNQKRSYINS